MADFLLSSPWDQSSNVQSIESCCLFGSCWSWLNYTLLCRAYIFSFPSMLGSNFKPVRTIFFTLVSPGLSANEAVGSMGAHRVPSWMKKKAHYWKEKNTRRREWGTRHIMDCFMMESTCAILGWLALSHFRTHACTQSYLLSHTTWRSDIVGLVFPHLGYEIPNKPPFWTKVRRPNTLNSTPHCNAGKSCCPAPPVRQHTSQSPCNWQRQIR